MSARAHKYLKGVLVLTLVVAAFLLAREATESAIIKETVLLYGYTGVFFLSAVAGFNIVVPVPAIAFVPLFFESGLNIAPTLFVIALGTTFGDFVGYALGLAGRELAEDKKIKILAFLEQTRERHYWWPIGTLLFYSALVPFPNEILVIPLAFLGYKFKHIFITVLAGNLVF